MICLHEIVVKNIELKFVVVVCSCRWTIVSFYCHTYACCLMFQRKMYKKILSQAKPSCR